MTGKSDEFSPNLMFFSCNWCFPAGPGYSVTLPEGTSAIRTLCTGRIHPSFILRALENGADGVFIAACAEGECHYETGNTTVLKAVKRVEDMLALLGVDPLRLRVEMHAPGKVDGVLEALAAYRREVAALGPLELEGKRSEMPEVSA